jgi:crossover junction endodeoxyribonuclease RuvC
MIVLGVDPGSRSGAYAVLDTQTGFAVVGDLPTTKDGVNAAEFARIVRQHNPHVAVVERVNAFPGQGVSSSFSFGRGYGTILGVIGACETPVELYTPVTWKRFYNLPGKEKERARQKAIELFPSVAGLSRKCDHGRSEALLLANFYVLKRG